MSIKAVVFDCFGVLYISPLTILEESCQAKDLQQLRDAWAALHAGMLSVNKFVALATELTSYSSTEVQSMLQKSLVKHEQLFTYCKELQKRGIQLAVLSNIDASSIKTLFSIYEQNNVFDTIAASGSLGVSKPHHLAYEHVLRSLNVQPKEAVMIDDSLNNIHGAEAVGMKGIVFTSLDEMKKELEEMISA